MTGLFLAVASDVSLWPIFAALAGVVTVLGLMIVFRCNAFLALLLAALVVAMLSGTGGWNPMQEVMSALGSTAGGIAIVIAMAAVIGKCMLDSGSADRIVNAAISVTGEKKAPLGLLGSGFVLAVPVFFDTVFYLLVPLARSLYQRTKKNYLLYIMAVGCGGAITHTLVPPTPGPLLVAANLGVDVGAVMLVGLLVAAPSSVIGLLFCYFMDRVLNIPMRPVAGVKADSPANDEEDLEEKEHPTPLRQVPLWLALAPVVLPVLMITSSTIATTIADNQDRGKLVAEDLTDATAFAANIASSAAADAQSPAGRILASSNLSDSQRTGLTSGSLDADAITTALNSVLLDKSLFEATAFQDVGLDESLRTKLSANHLRTKPAEMRHLNRLLLEATFPNQIAPHEWNSTARMWANRLDGIGNASLALTIAAVISILTLAWARHRTFHAISGDVEEALMSGGLIILITAAGGAFGGMLQKAGISEAIQGMIDLEGSGGLTVMLLGFVIAALLKVAQGSSTVAMIIGSSMVAAMVDVSALDYHPAYLVTAIGGGSLIGSWMNDSGFWVFTKMGGLTESESLKTWTPLLSILGLSSLVFSLILATIVPMR